MSDSRRNAEGTDHDCGLFKSSQMKKRVFPPRSRCHVAAVAVGGGGGDTNGPAGGEEEGSESGGLLRRDAGSPDHTGAEGPTFCGVSKQTGSSQRLLIVLRGGEATMATTSREQSRGFPRRRSGD